MKAKLTFSKKIFKTGIRGTEREGVIFMARINFGLTSILATLKTEADWRSIMEGLDRLKHHVLI